MRKALRLFLVWASISSALSTAAVSQQSNGGTSQLLSVLAKEFQKRNPNIARVEIFDIRPLLLNPIHYPEKPNHYLVIARGIRADMSFQGNFSDELLGVFLLDDSLFSVKRALDFVPTQRWGDFILKVVKIWDDTVTVRGEDLERGETGFVRRYYLER